MPAKGLSKNLGITVLLIAPLAAVTLLMWWIFTSLASGNTLKAPPVGQGAGDTGGANAIGEELAGNDADEVQRINRLLRTGELIEPAKWPAGLVLTVPDPGLPDRRRPSIAYERTGLNSVISTMTRDRGAGVFKYTIEPAGLLPGSPIYLGIGGISIVRTGATVTATDGEGTIVAAFTLEPVPTQGLDPETPLTIDVSTLGVELTMD